MPIENAFGPEHLNFVITDIKYEDDVEAVQGEFNFERVQRRIEPRYTSPAISVDSKGRFTKHEIIGGTTVRQKTGEDPLNVSVSGVCTESTARALDNLRDAKYGTITSPRLPSGGRIDVQFASVSTSPIDDSGGVALEEANEPIPEFLYNYTLECIEINIPERL